jgi:hypothetical protein
MRPLAFQHCPLNVRKNCLPRLNGLLVGRLPARRQLVDFALAPTFGFFAHYRVFALHQLFEDRIE